MGTRGFYDGEREIRLLMGTERGDRRSLWCQDEKRRHGFVLAGFGRERDIIVNTDVTGCAGTSSS